jgi:DNA-binding transcriptional regulator YhcF (GntR family)
MRKDRFFENYVSSLIEEAGKLGLKENDIKEMIERGFKR